MRLIIGTGDEVMPTRNEAKEAVKSLLGYLEKNVEREGLLDTPYKSY
jgi:GTP cyclohydrolase I